MGVGSHLQTTQQQQYEIAYCGLPAPNPASDRVCLLTTGLTVTGATSRNSFVVGEIAQINGYSRTVMARQITSVDATNDLLTIPEHNLANGTRVFFMMATGSSIPGGLAVGTPYWIVNSTASTVQLSLTLNGSAVNITGSGTGTFFVRPSGSFNSTTNRFEGNWDPATFSASGGNLTYQGYYILRGASSGLGNVSISAVDTTLDQFTTTLAHGMTTGDELIITVDSGGVLPGGLTANISYYGRNTGAQTFTLHPTAADATANTNKIDITSSGTLPLRMRNATGYVDGFEWFSSSQTILDTRQQIIRIYRNTLNAGSLNGV